MRLYYYYYNVKNTCLRIRVSYENQSSMSKYIDASFTPLFALKKDQHYSLQFEFKTFTCSHLKVKHTFFYKDVQKIETTTDGVIIYLNNNCYVSISTENNEKHNTALYDVLTLLKRRCWRSRFSVVAPISYPENDSIHRYQSDREAIFQISFSLTDTQIKQLLLYDYLFSEKMIILFVAMLTFVLLALVLWNVLPLVIVIIFAVICLFALENSDGYIKNHQGRLHMLMYDNLLVVRLHDTDLELEYDSMKQKKDFLGLWRLKCNDFFTFVLPKKNS